jgi:hypothetical protein
VTEERQGMVGVEQGECESTVLPKIKNKLRDSGFVRLGGGRPAVHGVVQLAPLAVPEQLAQSVVGDPHPIIFSQTEAAAGPPHAAERKRNGVAQ